MLCSFDRLASSPLSLLFLQLGHGPYLSYPKPLNSPLLPHADDDACKPLASASTLSAPSHRTTQHVCKSHSFLRLGLVLSHLETVDAASSPLPREQCDVNTVTFADETGNLVYSGSDDNLCKVWDRRCLRKKEQAAGVLIGHLEGITFIDSRGDGRYFISNGKDQTTKLWDIRKMSSESRCPRPVISDWDYRWMDFPSHAKHLSYPYDQSLATYRGHLVLRTLIRCYFSPSHSTGQRYIYTGSHDNCVYIYDVVTGDQVARLNCHQMTVRDCSWHPYYPILVSSAWDGLVARWEFPGSDKAPAFSKSSWASFEDHINL